MVEANPPSSDGESTLTDSTLRTAHMGSSAANSSILLTNSPGKENLHVSPPSTANYGDENACSAPRNVSHDRPTEPPYHILSHSQKWRLVCLVSIAGSFSPLSSNIYFPAIEEISLQLRVNASLVAITITVYMIVQAISPSLWAPISDSSGRRITFGITLAIYTAANLALAFTSNFPMLLVLRGVQALGSAATISISAGVIADIATPGERGGFMGTNAGTRMISQAVGPVLGGLLTAKWGFRSIFWLLFAQSSCVLMLLIVFLPETHRRIAGNGSTPLRGIHKPVWYWLRPPPSWKGVKTIKQPVVSSLSLKAQFAPLMHIFQKDIFVLLAWGSLIYTIWSMVTSSTTTVLLHSFPGLKQWQIGLCFIPNGCGCILGSTCTGWLLDRTFSRVQAEHRQNTGIPEATNIKEIRTFPFERARLRFMPYFSLCFVISTALYGPSFELNDLNRYFAANLVASLGLQFMIAFTATAIFSINSTLMVDYFPDGAASATATNNLVRCLVGAAGVSVIQPLIQAVKIRNAFLILTGVVVIFSPLLWVQWKYSAQWRMERERQKLSN
ncbi:hypothetical protein QQS21_012066 [Conoideocrella luteorostrata]|uniref:Major facilitator superfamily (MFS) profile domain-containing protein n=1 Tax=Conoideocrella luteorostrata TaxID=1105319 RepID=A0AAJ0FV82_9HYPO|nr:hypothetical protein QQS21_012066 [Conoideocrella luteorostrata]